MELNNNKYRQIIVFVLIFSVSYLVAGLLTPKFANMKFSQLPHYISQGMSRAQAAVK